MARATLEWLGNCCLIVACIVVTAAAGKTLLSKPAPAPGATQPEYARGDTLPPIDGVEYGSKGKTLVLFVSSHCVYCTESVPFYQKMAAARQQSNLQIIAVGAEPVEVLTDYLNKHSVSVDRVVTLRRGQLKLSGTPTLILTDRLGHVTGLWKGALREREAEVQSAVVRSLR